MTRPNLFTYATSELSQDAFIAWLLAWADPACRQADGPLHLTGVALLDRLLDLAGVARPAEYRAVKVRRQFKKIDVLAVVNGDIVVLVEDKTHTQAHSRQLPRYLEVVAKHFAGHAVAPIYLKTGDQCRYDQVEGAGYKPFLRRHFLDVLRHGQSLDVRSDIYSDFLGHLQGIEDGVLAFRSEPPAAWVRCSPCWVGFFTALQGHLAGAWWKQVKPPRGASPFMGMGWRWTPGQFRDTALARFLHLEEGRLCFKLEVKAKDKTLRAGAWREWRDAVLAEASGISPAVEPGQFRPGTWMTVAFLDGYRRTAEAADGPVDMEQTVTLLRTVEEVHDRALARLALRACDGRVERPPHGVESAGLARP